MLGTSWKGCVGERVASFFANIHEKCSAVKVGAWGSDRPRSELMGPGKQKTRSNRVDKRCTAEHWQEQRGWGPGRGVDS